MDAYGIIGTVAALIVLGAFIGNEYGKIPRESIVYDLANLAGSAGLFAYAWHTGAVPFILINAVWAAAAGVHMVKRAGPRGLKRARK